MRANNNFSGDRRMGEEGTMAKVICTSIFLVALLFMLVPVETKAVREIPDDNLSYPVLINLSNCTANQDQ
jgi:hypothetical protein